MDHAAVLCNERLPLTKQVTGSVPVVPAIITSPILAAAIQIPDRYADYQQGWTLILGWLARQY